MSLFGPATPVEPTDSVKRGMAPDVTGQIRSTVPLVILIGPADASRWRDKIAVSAQESSLLAITNGSLPLTGYHFGKPARTDGVSRQSVDFTMSHTAAPRGDGRSAIASRNTPGTGRGAYFSSARRPPAAGRWRLDLTFGIGGKVTTNIGFIGNPISIDGSI